MGNAKLRVRVRAPQGVAALPAKQLKKLREWLAEPLLTLAKIRELLKSEFGVNTSIAALSAYQRKHAIHTGGPQEEVKLWNGKFSGLEISIHAPGASEIRVKINPLNP